MTEAAASEQSEISSYQPWRERFPWLVHGVTRRGTDYGLFGKSPVGTTLARWRTLREQLACHGAVHARQVHGARVLWHEGPTDGLLIVEDADGHATERSGILLAVSVADCVPIMVIEPDRRVIALLHAGWRGVAAGVLEAGIDCLARNAGVRAATLHVYCGPAICGACYEVGPEVFGALGQAVPEQPRPLDLRAVIGERATAAGIPAANLAASPLCTRCDPGFYSHRGGDSARQIAFLGISAHHEGH